MRRADDRLELGMIADRESGQGQVLVARLPQASQGRPVDDSGVLGPMREIESRGLAEPAALRTAAGRFDGHAVKDDAKAGDDDLLRKERAREILHLALADGGRGARPWARDDEGRAWRYDGTIKGRNVDALDPGQLAEPLTARQAPPAHIGDGPDDLRETLLAVPESTSGPGY